MERASKPPTIMDVARAAGVSKSTVSNVVNGRPASGRTRRYVLDAIDRLGYQPNQLARQLVQQRTKTLGVIARDLSNPFIAEMARLVEREAAQFGFVTMISSTEGIDRREEVALKSMLQHRVAGVIFLSFPSNPSASEATVRGRVPCAFIGCDEPWGDSVTVNDYAGGELAGRHLVSLGHRSMAFMGPRTPDDADEARWRGFSHVVSDAGLPLPVFAGWDPPATDIMIDNRLRRLDDWLLSSAAPTAVFAANDFAAIDLMDVADSVAIAVPDDLSIVGFDDVAAAGLRRIGLTTLAQKRDDLVRIGVQTLMGRIEGTIAGPAGSTLTQVRLVIRRSTAPPVSQRPHSPHEDDSAESNTDAGDHAAPRAQG